jgi:hypothetical protein
MQVGPLLPRVVKVLPALSTALALGVSGPLPIAPASAAPPPPPIWESDFGVALSISSDDDNTQTVTLPFTFSFQGADYTEVTVSTNGFIWLGGDSGDECCNGNVPDFLVDPPRIAPMWFDLNPGESPDPGVTTGVFYNDSISGEAVITFVEVPEFGTERSFSFQTILFDDGTICFGYHGISRVSDHDVLTGVTPGDGADDPGATDLFRVIKKSLDTGSEGTVYEFYPGGRKFDLKRRNVCFIPNGFDGWVVSDSDQLP